MQLLLSNGAEFNENQEKGTNPLYIAHQNGHDRIVDLLLGKSGSKSTARIPCESSDSTSVIVEFKEMPRTIFSSIPRTSSVNYQMRNTYLSRTNHGSTTSNRIKF